LFKPIGFGMSIGISHTNNANAWVDSGRTLLVILSAASEAQLPRVNTRRRVVESRRYQDGKETTSSHNIYYELQALVVFCAKCK
jgi:hypothetical protein